MFTTPLKSVTYLGVPAESFVVAHSKNASKLGLRVSVVRWLADADDANGVRKAGDVSVTCLTGDGRKPTATVHAKALLPQADDATVLEWAEGVLS